MARASMNKTEASKRRQEKIDGSAWRKAFQDVDPWASPVMDVETQATRPHLVAFAVYSVLLLGFSAACVSVFLSRPDAVNYSMEAMSKMSHVPRLELKLECSVSGRATPTSVARPGRGSGTIR